MTTNGEIRPPLSNEAYLQQGQQWLREAVEAVTGNPDDDPRTVFPTATEVREDTPPVRLEPEAEGAFRAAAANFGIGGEENVLSGARVEVLEGGKLLTKVRAEQMIAHADTVIYAGTPERPLGKDERAYIESRMRQQGISGVPIPQNEHEGMAALAMLDDDFHALPQPEIINAGYEIESRQSLRATNQPTGQLARIGTSGSKDVYHLRVDRQYLETTNAQGKQEFVQPDAAALMGFVADALPAMGLDSESSIGVLTSNTYASRAIAVRRAGVEANRSNHFSVGMYGRATLGEAQREAGLPAAPVNVPTTGHVAGELNTIRDELDLLHAALQKQRQGQ